MGTKPAPVEGDAFNEAQPSVYPGQAAPPVLDAAGYDLPAEGPSRCDGVAQERGVERHAEGIEIVEEDPLRPGAGIQLPGEGPVEEEVGDLVPMAHRMYAL